MERDCLAAVARTDVLTGAPRNLHVPLREASLNAKGTALSALTRGTMTDGNAHRVTRDLERELTAATACFWSRHSRHSDRDICSTLIFRLLNMGQNNRFRAAWTTATNIRVAFRCMPIAYQISEDIGLSSGRNGKTAGTG